MKRSEMEKALRDRKASYAVWVGIPIPVILAYMDEAGTPWDPEEPELPEPELPERLGVCRGRLVVSPPRKFSVQERDAIYREAAARYNVLRKITAPRSYLCSFSVEGLRQLLAEERQKLAGKTP